MTGKEVARLKRVARRMTHRQFRALADSMEKVALSVARAHTHYLNAVAATTGLKPSGTRLQDGRLRMLAKWTFKSREEKRRAYIDLPELMLRWADDARNAKLEEVSGRRGKAETARDLGVLHLRLDRPDYLDDSTREQLPPLTYSAEAATLINAVYYAHGMARMVDAESLRKQYGRSRELGLSRPSRLDGGASPDPDRPS
jgi:hypothetical protein